MNNQRFLPLMLGALGLSACGGGANGQINSYPAGSLVDAASVQNLYVSAAGLAFFAAIGQPGGSTATCPHQTTDGNTTTTSGCTDTGGTVYAGTITAVHNVSADTFDTHFDAFTITSTQQCTPIGGAVTMVTTTSTINGTTTATRAHAAQGTYHVDLTITGTRSDPTTCAVSNATEAVFYDGTWAATGADANMDGQPDHVTWNGMGRIGNSVSGSVTTQTTSEVVDNTVCSHEPASGTTQLTSGGHTVVITYDGATDCSMDSTATWTLDGVAQGTLTGIACSVSHGGRGGRSVLLSGLAIGLAAIVRRARRTTRSARRSA